MPRSCSGSTRLATWPGPITACTPGSAATLVLEAVERGQALGVGDRAVVADGDDLERRVPAGADRAVDQFGVLARRGVLGQLFGARRPGLQRDRHQARAPTRRPEGIAEASPEKARHLCRGAIVGTGSIEALISLAAGPIAASSPLTHLQRPARRRAPDGRPPRPDHDPGTQTFAIVVPIERRPGEFRYRATIDVPPIAGGLGAITHLDVKIGRRFSAGGKHRSYVAARCSDGILRTHGRFSFADGTSSTAASKSSAGPGSASSPRLARARLPILAGPGPLAQLVRAGAS